jgi:hypothetical protein
MKREPLLPVLLSFILIVLALPMQAQVSFFQPPTYAGSGIVFVADFNGDGKPDILCSDGTLNLGNGDGTFRLGTPVSGTPLAVADFNGDGKPDILEQGSGTLLVLLGNGDGTFQSPITTQIGASLLAVTAVDLNGDGKADVLGVFSGTLWVYLGKGDGTFAPGVAYSLGAAPGAELSLYTSISLGDFNGDNRTDVVVTVENSNVPTQQPIQIAQEIVLLGNGDGTFQTAKAAFDSLIYPSPVAVGDFNGDGKLDLAVTGSLTDLLYGTYVLLGNGDGTLQKPTSVIPGQLGELATADVNGDGKLDLVVQPYAKEVQIYLGNGDGYFANSGNYLLSLPIRGNYLLSLPIQGAGQGVLGIVVADLNGDGKLDIAGGNGVLLGNGDGTFQGIPLSVVPNGIWPSSGSIAAVVARFDNAGAPGMAVLGNGGVSILTNDGSGSLSLAHTYPLQGEGSIILARDFNGDGNLDLLVIGSNSDLEGTGVLDYAVLLGNGDGSFRSAVSYPLFATGYRSISAVTAGFRGYGLDVAIAISDGSDGALIVLWGNGDGTFSPFWFLEIGLNPLLVADFNYDRIPDLAGGAIDPATNIQGTAILLGNGNGTFEYPDFPIPFSAGFVAIATADLNNDGKPDLLSSNQVSLGAIPVSLGDVGNGSFTLLPPLFPLASAVISPVTADFNVDGKLDLVVTVNDAKSGYPAQSGILLGNGDGTFGPMINVPSTGYLPSTFMVADMNGDGRPDIVFPTTIGYGVLLNTTPPGFELSGSALSPAPVTVGNSATSTVTATPVFGFNEAVTLSCAGLPSGASCAFNPPSIANSSGMSTLTISTTASIAVGTYPVQVQGSAGSIANSVALSLVIIQAPDFSVGMASGSSSQRITVGQTATFNLAITPSGSFTGTINLSCGITPVVAPSPTCTPSSSSVQISGSGAQQVTVTVRTIAPMTTGTVSYVGFPHGTMPLAWALMLLCSGWLWLRNRKRLQVLVAPLMVLVLASCVSCGGNSSQPSQTTPGTYTATITASSGSLSHNMALQVVVQ